MSWASKIKAHGQKQARAKVPARPRPKVQETYFTVRNASDNGDPGEVAPCYFIEDDGMVTLTDRSGKEIGKPVPLEGRPARSIAAVLAKAAWKKDGGDFSRRLEYPNLRIA